MLKQENQIYEAMSRREFDVKSAMIDDLLKQGYRTYAKLLNLFDIHITKRKNFIAAVDVENAVIYIVDGLPRPYWSTIIRHEILHRWLEHTTRLQQHLNVKNLRDIPRDSFRRSNIAGDYEISNRGYTDTDKEIVKNLTINGIKMSGLVTEVDHKDWVNLTFEEMYDKLEEESEKLKQQALNDLEKNQSQYYGNQDGSSDSNSSQGQDNSNDNSSDSRDNQKKEYSQSYKDGFAQAIADYKAGKLKL